jgi:hypothetical protein
LVGVVILSGCVGQGGGRATVSNGIIIKDFFFDYSPIYAGDDIGLTLEVQNVGGDVGTLKKVTVFGIDWKPEGQAGPLQWSLPTDESFEVTPNVDLLPPDPTTGFEGEEWSVSWLPRAPEGVRASTTYDFEVRVEYGYDTTYTGTIRVIESDYLRTLSQEERDALVKQGGVIESTVTGGPISVSAASGRHFIVRESTPEKRTIKFKITNIGSGYPFDVTLTPENLYVIRVAEYVGLKECDEKVKLSRGKTGTLSCKIEVPGTDDVVNKIDKKFSITFSYEYYVDSATSITVNPTYEEMTTMPMETTTTSTTLPSEESSEVTPV